MKKTMYIILAVLMILGLAACGSDNQEATTEGGFSPSLDTSTSCNITVAGGYDNFEALETEFDSFHKYYPNVEMKLRSESDAQLVPADQAAAKAAEIVQAELAKLNG